SFGLALGGVCASVVRPLHLSPLHLSPLHLGTSNSPLPDRARAQLETPRVLGELAADVEEVLAEVAAPAPQVEDLVGTACVGGDADPKRASSVAGPEENRPGAVVLVEEPVDLAEDQHL